MPVSPVVLNIKTHARLTWKALEDYSFAAGMTVVPLLVFEVPGAARCFPIIFANPRNAMPYALLGLGGRNIFVDAQGRWTAPCLPLMLSNYPFSLAEIHQQDGEDAIEKRELAVAIVEDAPHFHQPDGVRLYDGKGKPTQLLRHVTTVMGNQYRHYADSRKSLEELNLTGALRERVAGVRTGGGERAVGGLRVADREAVMSLPDVTLGKWARDGVLEMLFAHWESMRHLGKLLDDPSCPKGKENGAGEEVPVQ